MQNDVQEGRPSDIGVGGRKLFPETHSSGYRGAQTAERNRSTESVSTKQFRVSNELKTINGKVGGQSKVNNLFSCYSFESEKCPKYLITHFHAPVRRWELSSPASTLTAVVGDESAPQWMRFQ